MFRVARVKFAAHLKVHFALYCQPCHAPRKQAIASMGGAAAVRFRCSPAQSSVRCRCSKRQLGNSGGAGHCKVPGPYQPSITETIRAQGNSTVVFNFGTATDAFMTMDVSAADGAQTPPPWSNISLSQPISGYNGTLFTISLFGPYFSVNVP
jgi:hypothetical protein